MAAAPSTGSRVPFSAVIAALTAAVLHATWNALVKRSGDPLADLAVVWIASASLALGVALFFPLPVAAAWPYLLASTAVHVPYGLFLAAAYRSGSLSHVYTIARGAPPLLVALVTAVFGEMLAPGAYGGIALISLGIFTTGLSPDAPLKATLMALCVALTIAAYTVTDGIGARVSGEPIGYSMWNFILIGITFSPLVAVWRGPRMLLTYVTRNWRRAAIGGPASVIAYTLVLWAMTFAPVAEVSALRETSVAVAAFIGWIFMSEHASAGRIAGVALVLIGALMLRFA